jgi:hypothetical protein
MKYKLEITDIYYQDHGFPEPLIMYEFHSHNTNN